MADTGTTRDRIWGSVTNERDEAFMATVALFPHGQIWFYAHDIASWCPTHIALLNIPAVYACTASSEDPPTWTPSQQQLKDASSLKKRTHRRAAPQEKLV